MKSENIEDVYGLSPLQEGLLFHSLYEPEPGVYFSQFGCRLENLQAEAFMQAWQAVVDRHEVLRSGFIWKGVEQPVQVVARQVGLPVERQDWRGLSEEERNEKYEKYLQTDRRRGFKLERAPLMRIVLFREGENDYRFVWSIHHLLIDGWSKARLMQEVVEGYETALRGDGFPREAVCKYKAYINWLKHKDLNEAEKHWREELKGSYGGKLWKTERKRKLSAEKHGERRVSLSESETEILRQFARKQKVTMSAVVEGAWSILLSHYYGEDDVIYGVTVSGRSTELENVEEIIGVLINTLPMRVEVKSWLRVGEWLRELQQKQLKLREYDYTPLVKIHEWSGLERGETLFETRTVFQNYPVNSELIKRKQQELSIRITEEWSIEQTNYPITMTAALDENLSMAIGYNSQLFDVYEMDRLFSHLTTILKGMTADPEQRVGAVSPLTERERYQIITEWNDTGMDVPSGRCLQELIEAQVMRTPHAVAVVWGERQLTYSDLDMRANRIANCLRSLDVGPETRVGVCLEPSITLVVALLGALKSGAAFVPIDPAYPAERLNLICHNAAFGVALTERRLADKLPALKAICLDSDDEIIGRQSVDLSPVDSFPEAAAYAIYTSGSTGAPEAVVISHQSLVNHSLSAAKKFDLRPGDRFLQFASIGFDVMLEEIFPALVSGSSVVMRDEPPALSCRELIDFVQERQISIINLPTAYWHELVNEMTANGSLLPECARLVIVGGERIALPRVAAWQRFGIPLMHAYGLTEATITSTLGELCWDEIEPAASGLPSIGRPIANTQVYILNKHLQPVPIGIVGEIYVGGAGVARCYLNDTELTAERFRPDPFGEIPGGRLHKTQDSARCLPDGNIEFLGRLDSQLKIRGYRVEPGEIEAVILEHTSVLETTVRLSEGSAGDKRLIAYVVSRDNDPRIADILRILLRGALPKHMIPHSFVILDSLPLTINGKIDHRALPAPREFIPGRKTDFQEPRTDLERKLAQMWAEALGIARLDVNGNFFALGGHSLLAIRVISRIRKELQVDIPLSSLFDAPTVSEFAHLVVRCQIEQAEGDIATRIFAEVESL